MPHPTLTVAKLAKLRPCAERMQAMRAALPARKRINAAEAVAAGATLDDLVWVASAVARTDADVERRVRLWLADCAARVLPIFEKERPADPHVREAIVAARDYARGRITAAARAAAWDAARDAAWAAAKAAAKAAARDAARAAAWDAAWDAAWAAAWDAAWDAEEQWQLQRLVLWLTDEPEDWPLDAVVSEAAE